MSHVSTAMCYPVTAQIYYSVMPRAKLHHRTVNQLIYSTSYAPGPRLKRSDLKLKRDTMKLRCATSQLEDETYRSRHVRKLDSISGIKLEKQGYDPTAPAAVRSTQSVRRPVRAEVEAPWLM